jgi:hypothetical protein
MKATLLALLAIVSLTNGFVAPNAAFATRCSSGLCMADTAVAEPLVLGEIASENIRYVRDTYRVVLCCNMNCVERGMEYCVQNICNLYCRDGGMN